MKKIISGLLLIWSFSSSANLNNIDKECLKIETFKDLSSFSNFDSDMGWSLSTIINNPYDLRAIDNIRLRAISSKSGIRFMLDTNFDNSDKKLTRDTFIIDGTGRSYDIYLYEAGDNGSGFIFETGSDEVVATISDGIGGEISGCIKF